MRVLPILIKTYNKLDIMEDFDSAEYASLSVLWTFLVLPSPRTCVDKYVSFLQNGDRYCRRECEPAQKCGPVPIPAEHLGPCRSCDYYGHNCEVGEGGDGVSVGAGHLLLYVSAIQSGKQCGSASEFNEICIAEFTRERSFVWPE